MKSYTEQVITFELLEQLFDQPEQQGEHLAAQGLDLASGIALFSKWLTLMQRQPPIQSSMTSSQADNPSTAERLLSTGTLSHAPSDRSGAPRAVANRQRYVWPSNCASLSDLDPPLPVFHTGLGASDYNAMADQPLDVYDALVDQLLEPNQPPEAL